MIVPDYDDDDDFYAAQAMMANGYDENWEPETLNSWIYSTGTLFDLDEE